MFSIVTLSSSVQKPLGSVSDGWLKGNKYLHTSITHRSFIM